MPLDRVIVPKRLEAVLTLRQEPLVKLYFLTHLFINLSILKGKEKNILFLCKLVTNTVFLYLLLSRQIFRNRDNCSRTDLRIFTFHREYYCENPDFSQINLCMWVDKFFYIKERIAAGNRCYVAILKKVTLEYVIYSCEVTGIYIRH